MYMDWLELLARFQFSSHDVAATAWICCGVKKRKVRLARTKSCTFLLYNRPEYGISRLREDENRIPALCAIRMWSWAIGECAQCTSLRCWSVKCFSLYVNSIHLEWAFGSARNVWCGRLRGEKFAFFAHDCGFTSSPSHHTTVSVFPPKAVFGFRKRVEEREKMQYKCSFALAHDIGTCSDDRWW